MPDAPSLSATSRVAVLTRLAESGHAIEVSGESMLPTLRAGDRITVLPDLEPRVGDVIVFVDAPGRTVVHRLVACVGGTVVCLGDNRKHYDTPVPQSHVIGVARATSAGCLHPTLRPTGTGWILFGGRCLSAGARVVAGRVFAHVDRRRPRVA